MASVLLLLTCAQLPAQQVVGQVELTLGNAVLVRGRTQYAAGALAGLYPGDELRADRGMSLRLEGGVIVYVGANGVLRLPGQSGAARLDLVSGELRVIGEQSAELQLVVPEGVVTFSAGALRLVRQPGLLRIGSERGSLKVALRGTRELALGEGQELRLQSGRLAGPVPYSASGWTIDEQRMLDAAADEELRRRTARAPAEAEADPTRSSDGTAEPMRRPPGNTQNPVALASVAAALSGFSASPAQSASAGLFADAAQFTLQGQDVTSGGGPFPGNIHLVTGESRYGLSNVDLNAAEANDIFAGGVDPAYFSIGLGASPTLQVSTDLNTASAASPHIARIPHFNAYVIKLEQYGTFDSTLDPANALNNNIGPAGLLGETPTAPTITNATPLADTRNASFNQTATFALGEFRLRPNGGPDNGSFELAVRHSDQDRKIVKDPMGNDANDLVTPNPDVGAFDDVADPRFLPAAPTVKVPVQDTFSTAGTRFAELNTLRRAAVTVLMADQLGDFARRTGRTRFVIDGKVIDISGYRRP